MEILAKSNGTTLKDHSNAVALRAREIATRLLGDMELKGDFGPQYSTADVVNACYVAGLVHDIGKAVPYFQDYIRSASEQPFCEDANIDYVEDADSDTRYHNEFSWATLALYGTELMEQLGVKDRKCWEAVKAAVFWHHSASADFAETDYGKGRLIFGSDKFDVKAIVDCLNDIAGTALEVKEVEAKPVPSYFATDPTIYEDNSLLMFIRTVLIRADREVSGYVSGREEKIFTVDRIECPSFFDRERFSMQMEIVDRANAPTNVVAAPAGFGKTIIGLAWALRFSDVVYWVCPRNAVIDSVYRGLVDLKSTLGLDLTIETMYTGKVQSTSEAVGNDRPHIIVTNIDAITMPLVSNRLANLQYDMAVKPMVFDEFHEFTMDNCPMYAAYNLLMTVRNDFVRAKSMMVSATPTTLFNATGLEFRNQINYLPKQNGHYEPQHGKAYRVEIVSSPSETMTENMVQVFNVVRQAQDAVGKTAGSVCFHSKFTEADKLSIMDRIYKMYGKHSAEEKLPVASGPIIRASMDISFRTMEIMVSSPNSDMQTIGRCNRWGEYEDAVIRMVIPDRVSASDRVYLDHNDFEGTHRIYKKWTETLKAMARESMTLADFYAILDQFNTDNRDLLLEYQVMLHKKGIKELVEQCYPRRPIYYKKNPKERGNTGSIRNTDPSIYFIVKDIEGKYVGPFQIGQSASDFTNPRSFKETFTPYLKPSELMNIVKTETSLAESFPILYNKLMGKGGKGGKRIVEYYGRNPSMWRNVDYPFIVRPTDMTYDSVLGWRETKTEE